MQNYRQVPNNTAPPHGYYQMPAGVQQRPRQRSQRQATFQQTQYVPGQGQTAGFPYGQNTTVTPPPGYAAQGHTSGHQTQPVYQPRRGSRRGNRRGQQMQQHPPGNNAWNTGPPLEGPAPPFGGYPTPFGGTPTQQGYTPYCPPVSQRRAPAFSNTIKRFNNWNYRWSHGCDVSDWHTSTTCQNPRPGHQRAATRENPMGGSMKDAHKTVLPQ